MTKYSDINIQELFEAVRSESTPGLFASEGPLYMGAVFARDSLVAGEHLVAFESLIPRNNILLVLASLQGLEYNSIREEEPGRIHHEYRHMRNVHDAHGRKLFSALSDKWGGSSQEMIYYGSIDATPLFVRLAVDYVRRYGDDILHEVIKGRDGQLRSFMDHLNMALAWIKHRIDQSDIGMIEFKRVNPKGILNQVWEDSDTSYLHIDGSLPNYNAPIAPIEVQGYAYDALKWMGEQFPGSVDKEMVEGYRKRIIEYFWLPEEQYFAKGLDRDQNGNPRPIRTPDSNGALLLDSDVLLDADKGRRMAQALVDMVMGSDFLTPAGIRCRSIRYKHLVEYPDYHGSEAVWAMHTANIMKGMLRHRYVAQARDLAQRIIDNMALHMGDYPYPELNFVDEHNKVIHPERQTGKFDDPRVNVPEHNQTWSKSALLLCLYVLANTEELASIT